MEAITRIVSDKGVVIFSKSSCCMCYAVKILFHDLGFNPKIHEIDLDPQGREIEKALIRLGCNTTSVPAVFIGGSLIGSTNEVMSLHLGGSLIFGYSLCLIRHPPKCIGSQDILLFLIFFSKQSDPLSHHFLSTKPINSQPSQTQKSPTHNNFKLSYQNNFIFLLCHIQLKQVMKLASQKAVVIFSKSSCCMSHTIKSLFYDLGVSPAIYELDEISNGREIERALQKLGCNPSVPAVFIGGQLIHNSTSTVMSLHLSGSLIPMLKRAGAIWL
ncbi:hypothetical protein MKX03_003488 [Papaver bracteatum]|nr:hypothetical protein MKX03_003488 [Papaver bracteatum]